MLTVQRKWFFANVCLFAGHLNILIWKDGSQSAKLLKFSLANEINIHYHYPNCVESLDNYQLSSSWKHWRGSGNLRGAGKKISEESVETIEGKSGKAWREQKGFELWKEGCETGGVQAVQVMCKLPQKSRFWEDSEKCLWSNRSRTEDLSFFFFFFIF